ncbi:hypothetical protein D3C78_1839090 [compost metagenome]
MQEYVTDDNVNQTEENLYFHVLFFAKDKQFLNVVQQGDVSYIKNYWLKNMANLTFNHISLLK